MVGVLAVAAPGGPVPLATPVTSTERLFPKSQPGCGGQKQLAALKQGFWLITASALPFRAVSESA